MNRDERLVFYDSNLNYSDPNREITGKLYFEQENGNSQCFTRTVEKVEKPAKQVDKLKLDYGK